MGDVEEIVRGLSEAARDLLIESAPGGYGRDDTAVGAELIGAGRWAAARALARKGLGDVDEAPYAYPKGLYFNNDDGLRIRDHLLSNPSKEGE